MNDGLGGDTPKIYLNSFAADTTLYDESMTETFYFTALDKNGDAIEYEEYKCWRCVHVRVVSVHA